MCRVGNSATATALEGAIYSYCVAGAWAVDLGGEGAVPGVVGDGLMGG